MGTGQDGHGQAPRGYARDRLGNGIGPIAVPRTGFVKKKSVSYGKELFGDFENAKLSDLPVDKVATVILLTVS